MPHEDDEDLHLRLDHQSQFEVEFIDLDGNPIPLDTHNMPEENENVSLVQRSKEIPLGRSHTKFGRKVT